MSEEIPTTVARGGRFYIEHYHSKTVDTSREDGAEGECPNCGRAYRLGRVTRAVPANRFSSKTVKEIRESIIARGRAAYGARGLRLLVCNGCAERLR